MPSGHVFKEVSAVKKVLWGGEFWTDGYYIATISGKGGRKVIEEYIKNQGRKKDINFRWRVAHEIGLTPSALGTEIVDFKEIFYYDTNLTPPFLDCYDFCLTTFIITNQEAFLFI
ncbi:MAG: transposase [Candidatus Pacebacteria bacterium]|nr:transposase [Candidatus Paceibacterota bacterium]